MTPAFPKTNEASKDLKVSETNQEEEEEEEEYDEESIGEPSVQGVDAIIEQEFERMLVDGRRLEDEDYD